MKYQIGIDIGGTFIKIGLLDEDSNIAARNKIPFPHTTPEDMVEKLSAAIEDLLKTNGISHGDVESLGIVVPGSIDPTGAIVLDAFNLDFHDVPLKALMQAQFPDIPVLVANDANGAALAELYKGAFVGCKTAVLFTLGTGLGGGIILNGHMFNGGRGGGVEIGHAILVDDGDTCTCGNRGCIEVYCSATGLANEGRKAIKKYSDSKLHTLSGGDEEKIDALLVTNCAKAGDPAAVEAFNIYVGHLSSACASLYNTLDPEVFAIGGGLSGAGDFLFKPLREQVSKKCFFKTLGDLVPAVMGNDAGMVGAALLHRDAIL